MPPVNTAVIDTCTINVTFAGDIKPILDTYCAIPGGCHTAGVSWGDFTTYTGFKPTAESGLALTRIKNGEMPPNYSNGPMVLSACEITKLTTWVNEGSQNN